MYSYADRLRVVELYIRLGKRLNATIRQLGYASAASEVVLGGVSCRHTLEQHFGAPAPAETRRHLQDSLAVLHKLRKAMVDPDRSPLSGNIDVDESAIPYRRDKDHLKRGGGSSTANQIWLVGAVERLGKHGVDRIRLARMDDRSSSSHTFLDEEHRTRIALENRRKFGLPVGYWQEADAGEPLKVGAAPRTLASSGFTSSSPISSDGLLAHSMASGKSTLMLI